MWYEAHNKCWFVDVEALCLIDFRNAHCSLEPIHSNLCFTFNLKHTVYRILIGTILRLGTTALILNTTEQMHLLCTSVKIRSITCTQDFQEQCYSKIQVHRSCFFEVWSTDGCVGVCLDRCIQVWNRSDWHLLFLCSTILIPRVSYSLAFLSVYTLYFYFFSIIILVHL